MLVTQAALTMLSHRRDVRELVHIALGSVPTKEFPCTSKFIRFVSHPIVVGILPVNELSPIFSNVSFVSNPTEDGMVLFKLLSSMIREVRLES